MAKSERSKIELACVGVLLAVSVWHILHAYPHMNGVSSTRFSVLLFILIFLGLRTAFDNRIAKLAKPDEHGNVKPAEHAAKWAIASVTYLFYLVIFALLWFGTYYTVFTEKQIKGFDPITASTTRNIIPAIMIVMGYLIYKKGYRRAKEKYQCKGKTITVTDIRSVSAEDCEEECLDQEILAAHI